MGNPVHPTEEGYAALADSIKQFANNVVVSARAEAAEAASKAAAPIPRPAARPKNPSAGRGGSPAPPRLQKEISRRQATTGRTGATLPEVATHGLPPAQGAAAAAPAARPLEATTEEAARAAVPPQDR